jgi:hypothetical protein
MAYKLTGPDLERIVAVIDATCRVCTGPGGRADTREAVTVLVAAITAFAGCTTDASEALLGAIAGLERARQIYVRNDDKRASEAS